MPNQVVVILLYDMPKVSSDFHGLKQWYRISVIHNKCTSLILPTYLLYLLLIYLLFTYLPIISIKRVFTI